MVSGYVVDFLFYVAVVGDCADEGRGTKANMVADLVKMTSLTKTDAAEVVATMVKYGKLVYDRSAKRYICTMNK